MDKLKAARERVSEAKQAAVEVESEVIRELLLQVAELLPATRVGFVASYLYDDEGNHHWYVSPHVAVDGVGYGELAGYDDYHEFYENIEAYRLLDALSGFSVEAWSRVFGLEDPDRRNSYELDGSASVEELRGTV